MRKHFTFFAMFFVLTISAQIQTGTYKSSSKNGDFLLKLNEDSTYEMTFFYGKYDIKNDTINFNTSKENTSYFTVSNQIIDKKPLNLKLNFTDGQIAYYASTIFVASQENESNPIEYKRLSDYIEMNASTYDYPKNFSVEIPKGNYLYLVSTEKKVTTVTKFNISNDVSEVTVEYDLYSFKNIKLKGYIDPKTKQLAISDGKSPLLFSFELDKNKENSTHLKPISISEEKNWLQINGFVNEADENYVDSSYSSYDKPGYVFKHTIHPNFIEAKKSTQTSQTKFLVVGFDLKNNTVKESFDAFVKNNENTLSSYMYDNYNADYDKFNYYLATEKDKNLLEKYKIKSDKALLFFDAQGEMIYHTIATFSEKEYDYFNLYGGINSELEKASQFAQLDAIISNKKANISEITTVFKKSIKLDSAYNYSDDTIAPPIIDAIDHDTKSIDEEAAQAVESAAGAIVDGEYNLIKDKQNLYALKSTLQQVQDKWLKVIEYNLSNSNFDKNFVTVAKAELLNSGFSNKLFNQQDKKIKDSDFKLLDYVFKNYQNIKVHDSLSNLSYDYSYYESPIDSVLNDVFYNNTNLSSNSDKKQIENVMNYYEQYFKISNNDFAVLQSYLNTLKEQSNTGVLNKKYIDYYYDYFNQTIDLQKNIIENLDQIYSKRSKQTYDSWESYKSSFSNLANDVAWYIVENTTDKEIVQKAIIWSETSLKISKNSHYYLDTLAQLYYKNGEKQKAISTEQKAIENGKNSENEEEYKETLQKMINGTY